MLIALELTLRAAQIETPGPVERSATSPPRPPLALPPPLDRDEERALWTRLARREASAEAEVHVTVLSPELVAARAWRRAEHRGAVAASARGAVRDALAAIAWADRVTLEVQIDARGESALDAQRTAASLELRAGDDTFRPSGVTEPAHMGLVREAAPGGPPRILALTLTAAFPRGDLWRHQALTLGLEAAGRPITVALVGLPIGESREGRY